MRYAVERLIELNRKEGCENGSDISDRDGFLLQARGLDQQLHDLLMDLHETDPSNYRNGGQQNRISI